eukprot:TRINITY_DN4147_c0_g1_i1.p1 TRINITY_DN4147_c0_g1~~TRINITY_DN4147_c0_g1_i1.p1  ORF type:complete len:204 (-),score=95.97 TRINITY_DN4147_c0_g1_i1:74-685(-)
MEDIQAEIDTLEAIYADEYTLIQTDPIQFKISIQPTDQETKIHITFTLGPNYPKEIPAFRIEGPHSRTSLGQCIPKFITALTNEADDMIGEPMLFQLVASLKEMIEAASEVDNPSYYSRDDEIEGDTVVIRLEEIKQEVLQGTPVTMETFNEWKAKFLLEMRGGKKAEKTKPSGRQLFETDKNLALSDIQAGDEDDEKEEATA